MPNDSANGKVFDADTHYQPGAESIVPYLDREMTARLPDLEQFKTPIKIGRAGQILEPPYRHGFRFGGKGSGWGSNPPRHLGEAGPRKNEERRFQHFMGSRYPSEGGEDYDVDARVRDMDEEGVTGQLLVPGVFTGHEDPDVDMGFIRAHHRLMNDVCGKYPGRLKTMIVVTPRSIEDSVAEIKRWSRESWAVALQLDLPLDYPVDHPNLDPIWAAADEGGLCIVHHSFATGYPGYRDLWDNPFIGRTASHPWAAMRMISAFLGAGLLDRYPNLRLSILESGFGWLPFWMKRMEDQVVYMGYVAEDLKHTMTEYMTGGRFFAGIVLHEGEDMVRMVNDFMGDHVLMFGSDYPHAESRFPDSVKIVQDWTTLGAEAKRKLFWDNAAKCYAL